MHVASLELCRELYELSGWSHDEHRHIEKVWIESFSTSEMGQGHEDYDKTSPKERRKYHIGEYCVRDSPKNRISIPEDVPWGWANRYYNETVKRSIPAYTLGYLLRKLPVRVNGGKYSLVMYKGWHNGRGGEWYTFGYQHINKFGMSLPVDDTAYFITEAETPENAAAKICRELFKQGILTRESA